jgi:Protein of unknown function (DUF1592)/Protein of unknown function (DUF1588)/Protein of unknown function (DUF1585)/Protein of unknown function (DUF1595)/Protein of unknown function (DUF1587)
MTALTASSGLGLCLVLGAIVIGAGCTGTITGSGTPSGPSGAGASPGAGAGASTGARAGASPGTGAGGNTGGTGTAGAGVIDVGRVTIHRLNNTEYDNTVRDLLGTTSQPAATFLAEEGLNFDNTATALGMTPGQYEGYLKAAGDLMTEALASPTRRARFLTCMPAAAGDACARQIVTTFGMKIYRRPLETAEIDRAMTVYDADFARAKNGPEAIGQAVRAMLASANFLYRIEYDAVPTSTTPHALTGYELASRLSYLHWSSMPDDALFEAAKSGKLAEAQTLEATVDRLLADGKSSAFVESFAGQWLDFRNLITHSTVPQVFPTYTTALADAMMTEGQLWFQEFLANNIRLTEWFTADFNYVNGVLAQHYGFGPPATPSQFVKVINIADQRRGFLGLASFLTQTSFPSRTAPTLRGAWVLSELLCSPPPPPPAMVPKLDESAVPAEMNQAPGSENVAARLARHRTDPSCAVCHQLLDPMGLGLERFDGIGRYRESYGNGDTIDPAGVLPDGTTFSGALELGTILAKDPRFTACAAKKLYTYALGREVDDYDAPMLQGLQRRWDARGLNFRNLIKEIVRTDAFRQRRGEPE